MGSYQVYATKQADSSSGKSMASSGSCDLGHLGAICRIILALHLPAITALFARAGPVSGAES